MSRRKAVATALAVSWFCLGSPAGAQPPPEVASRLHALGARVEVAETLRLYTSLMPKDIYAGVYPTRDLAYGSDDKQRLDLFTGAPGAGSKPVIVFVHGGGFTGGDKHAPGGVLYDNVMAWAARSGLVGVNLNYRLAPKAAWPAGADDVAEAVRWLQANIARYGGDPRRIYLWGHSAGGVHVADYLARSGGGEVAGAILSSGQIYDMTGPNVSKAYHGAEASAYPAMASSPGLQKIRTRLLVTRAELDPPAFRTQTESLLHALGEARRRPEVLEVKDHTHLSEILAIGTADQSLSGPVLGFVRSAARR